MGTIYLADNAPPGFFTGAVPDPTPDGPTPEEERALDDGDECTYCDHGRVLVFYCVGVCECGYCPESSECPHCGHEPNEGDCENSD